MIGMINSQMTNSCAGEIGRTSRQRMNARKKAESPGKGSRMGSTE